jgi:hypothetical protein
MHFNVAGQTSSKHETNSQGSSVSLTVQLHDDLVVSDENDRRHVNHAQGGRERLLVLGVQFDDLRQMSQSESETMPACGDETQTALDEPYKVRRLVFTLKKAASQSHTKQH